MSRVPPPRLCLDFKSSMSYGNNFQPDPPIRELRNRWPFFSEGELKWLLSPKKSGDHPDMESHMAQCESSKVENDGESCPGPVPSESPVAFPVEENADAEVGRSSFAFMNDRQGVECSSDVGYSLGPRSLVFQDIAVGSDGMRNRVGDGEVGCIGERPVESGHPNPFHMNPFCEGLDPIPGEDMQAEAPIVFIDDERASEKGVVEAECSSDEHNTAEYFTPSKESEDRQELSQNQSGVDDDEEEEEDEEEEVMNSAVKRMSFALEDGKKLPKFSPGEAEYVDRCLCISGLSCCVTLRDAGSVQRLDDIFVGDSYPWQV